MSEPRTAAGRALLNALAPITTQTLGEANDREWVKRDAFTVSILAIEAEARAAALDEARAAVEALPQGRRSRRSRYSDEEGNLRTDYSRPAIVVGDGRIGRDAALAAIDALLERT